MIEKSYFDDSMPITCECTDREEAKYRGNLCTTRWRLWTPEYSRQGMGKNVKFLDLKVLQCCCRR